MANRRRDIDMDVALIWFNRGKSILEIAEIMHVPIRTLFRSFEVLCREREALRRRVAEEDYREELQRRKIHKQRFLVEITLQHGHEADTVIDAVATYVIEKIA